MTELGEPVMYSELEELVSENEFLRTYLENHFQESGEYPLLTTETEVESYENVKYPNLIYKVSEDTFIHIYADVGSEILYTPVEPTFNDREKYESILNKIMEKSGDIDSPESTEEEQLAEYVNDLIDASVYISGESGIERLRAYVGDKVQVQNKDKYERIKYSLKRNIAGLGVLEPFISDTNNEDIHIIGYDNITVDHKAFSLVKSDVEFGSTEDYDTYLRNLGERINAPISDSNPIVDATLPDGSRINIMYSNDISIKGPSVTIRQAKKIPFSIMQITKWGTLSPKMAAYLWLCLENKQTVFVVGETASGKTTTLNSICSFIPRDYKLYTAEDTAEVIPPHDTWQQLITREDRTESMSGVEMKDLVASALRARPDYIIVGEVRGSEAQQAFNAAQTGHPILLTFHASDISSAIQRLNNNPMNVPKNDIVNADVMLFQNRIKREEDDNIVRRVTEVDEIVGYDGESDRIINQQVFQWNASEDEHEFTGINNSYILEDKVSELLGYENRNDIYDELDRREKIINRLINNDVIGYKETNSVIETIQQDGIENIEVIKSRDLSKDDR